MEQELRKHFEELYGAGGEIISCFAPGRVNLIGEHTDYNGGHVFPCALTIGTYGIARKREDRQIRLDQLSEGSCMGSGEEGIQLLTGI